MTVQDLTGGTPTLVPEWLTLLVDRLAEAAYVERFHADFAAGYAKPWDQQPDEVKAVWRRVASAVFSVGAEHTAKHVRWGGGHQIWSGTYGPMLGWDDTDIQRLEPFMLKYMAEVAGSIIDRARRVVGAST